FQHHNGIINDKSGCDSQRHQRQIVEAEAAQIHGGEGADERNGKEKAPFWVEKMPEIPELVYDSLRQGKYLQHSVDKIARELQVN
ncbi:hypothetical protein MJH54_31725, partial [Salmonella enterica subsp. enterica serovar Montevideo]|nr:hypothetical protein [Salmonella enterica subsp. enterica serovar Montevideo]